MGSTALPPNMYFILAAWLTSWSMAHIMKVMYMNSATGRIPTAAEPRAAPPIAASEMGVPTTRLGPNSSYSPRVTP